MQHEEFDVPAAMRRIRQLETELSVLRRKVKEYRVSGSYGQYLKSDWWMQLRREHCGDGAKCVGCDFGELLVLHHTSYDRLYGERTGDLIVLCQSCHNKLHKYLDDTYPDRSTNFKAGKTKKAFGSVFKRSWRDEFEVKLPGRRAGSSVAMKKGRKQAKRKVRERHQRMIEHAERFGG